MTNEMSFSRALEMLKDGKCVARTGWNGRGMFLYLVKGNTFAVDRPPLSEIVGEGVGVSYRAHIDMKAVDGTFVPWLASQSDLIEEDWIEVKINPAQAELEVVS